MKKKLALLGVAALILGSLPGCTLCLLPCYVCGALGGGGSTVAVDETEEALQEVTPSLQTRALTRAVVH